MTGKIVWTLKVACAIALVASAFLSITYSAVPRWGVWVVDEHDQPVEGITVRLVYQNHSVESKSHEQDLTTDSRGFVEFSAQVRSASVLSYAIYSLYAARAGIHASFGRHASVFAFGGGREGSAAVNDVVVDWTGSSDRMESRIVARRRVTVQ